MPWSRVEDYSRGPKPHTSHTSPVIKHVLMPSPTHQPRPREPFPTCPQSGGGTNGVRCWDASGLLQCFMRRRRLRLTAPPRFRPVPASGNTAASLPVLLSTTSPAGDKSRCGTDGGPAACVDKVILEEGSSPSVLEAMPATEQHAAALSAADALSCTARCSLHSVAPSAAAWLQNRRRRAMYAPQPPSLRLPACSSATSLSAALHMQYVSSHAASASMSGSRGGRPWRRSNASDRANSLS